MIKLNYNKLYYFRYKATLEGKLNVYDKTPLIFVIDIRQSSILGVNLHWIPKYKRTEFFESIVDIINKTSSYSKRRERMRLTYELLRKPKYRVGLQGLRMYYISGISNLKEVTKPEWDIVIGQHGRVSQYRMRKVYKRNEYKD